MRDFFEEYEQQEQKNQVFLGKQLEKQGSCFTQAFNLQEQMTSLCKAIAVILADEGEWEEIEDSLIEIILHKEVPVKDKVMMVTHWIENNEVAEEVLEKYLNLLDKPYSLLYKLRKTIELDDLPFNRKLIDALSLERIIRD